MDNENKDFLELINLIDTHRQNAYRKINEELVTMYYEIGSYLSNKVKNEKWGSKTIDNLAKYIQNAFPTLKGFTRSGLYRMIQFYETYKDYKIVAPLVRQISWTNNIIIFRALQLLKKKNFILDFVLKIIILNVNLKDK